MSECVTHTNSNLSYVHLSTQKGQGAHHDHILQSWPMAINSQPSPTLQNQSVWLKFHQRQDVKTQEGPKERMPQQDRAV